MDGWTGSIWIDGWKMGRWMEGRKGNAGGWTDDRWIGRQMDGWVMVSTWVEG